MLVSTTQIADFPNNLLRCWRYVSSGKTRAQVLREVIEISAFKEREYNPSFVLMQYFGYLRRDPDQAGYQFWLNVLNASASNNYRGMVCAFLTSAEYQRRFGEAVTRTNAECSSDVETTANTGFDVLRGGNPVEGFFSLMGRVAS